MVDISHCQLRRNGTETSWLILIALLMACTNSSCKKADARAQIHGDDPAITEDKGILHLEPFVVNLADAEDNRFLRVGIDLGLEKPLSEKEGSMFGARIRDAIILVLCTWRSDALLAPDGKQKLKEEMLRTLQDRLPDVGVKEIYFTDFLVQR